MSFDPILQLLVSPSVILFGYVLPAALLSLWTRALMRDWKRVARGPLPLITGWHFAAGTYNYRPWPTREDALSRYVVGFIPVFNVVLLAIGIFGILVTLPEALYARSSLREFLRRPI